MSYQLIKIGREANNDIVVDDPSISRNHAEIFRDDEGNFFITDLNSTNGTLINGVKLKGSVMLRKTDSLQMGSVTIPWKSYFDLAVSSNFEEHETHEKEMEPEDEDQHLYEEVQEDSAVSGVLGLIAIIGLIIAGYFFFVDTGSSSYSSNPNSAPSQQESSGGGSVPTNLPNKKPLTAWGCSQCSQVKYAFRQPDVHNCPVGYEYNGGFGTSHTWIDYGKQGSESYTCRFCHLHLSVDRRPDLHGCNYHIYGQAGTSSHTWD